MAPPSAVSRAEQRRQQSKERRAAVAAEVVEPSTALARPALSFAGATLVKAMPRELLDTGLISFGELAQVRVANYDRALLAPNPQRGRLEDRGLDELAASLDRHGQQEPIVARLITPLDRKRWPREFKPEQILLILKGHRLYQALPKTRLRKLRVELMLPLDGESDLDYSRRALRRASIQMMHSQGYTIFDKVHLYLIWRDEFALKEPKDQEVAGYFEISRTEAQRVKVVAQLDPAVATKIQRSPRPVADEIVFTIANRPREEQRVAYERYGHLTVAAMRQLLQRERQAPPADAEAGRPPNFSLRVAVDGNPVVHVTTNLTARQWRRRGGTKAFWQAVRELSHSKDLNDRLTTLLG